MTTTDSGLIGNYIDINTVASNGATSLDENTASTTSGNFMLVPGLNSGNPTDPESPSSTTRVMVISNEDQINQ